MRCHCDIVSEMAEIKYMLLFGKTMVDICAYMT